MNSIPPISEAEWKVMKLLWSHSPQPAYDIIQTLGPQEAWHPNTVKTLLSRLCKKKALKVERYKNLYRYSPQITEDDAIQAQSQTLLDRVFGGSVRPLLIHFARRKKLTQADLDELRKILKEER